MRVAIVGHGPSLLTRERGADIDRHDAAVRMKRSWNLLQRPAHFGSRVDYVVGSCTLGKALAEQWPTTPLEYWIFNDTRTEHIHPADYVKDFAPVPVFIDIDLCREWRERYRKIRKYYNPIDGQERKGKLSDSYGHRHPSAGMHALFYALVRLKPEKVTLYGYDSVNLGMHSWSVTRGPEWRGYPDHNWPCERTLLVKIADEYGYDIEKRDTLIILNRRNG